MRIEESAPPAAMPKQYCLREHEAIIRRRHLGIALGGRAPSRVQPSFEDRNTGRTPYCAAMRMPSPKCSSGLR